MLFKGFMTTLATTMLSAPAWADYCWTNPLNGQKYCYSNNVPEVSSAGSLAAIVVVAALAAIAYERRRRA